MAAAVIGPGEVAAIESGYRNGAFVPLIDRLSMRVIAHRGKRKGERVDVGVALPANITAIEYNTLLTRAGQELGVIWERLRRNERTTA